MGKLKGCIILAVIGQWCEDTMSACSMHWHGEGFILYIKIKRFDTSKKKLLKAQNLFCSDKYNYISLISLGWFLEVKGICMLALFKKEKRVVDLTKNRGCIPPH